MVRPACKPKALAFALKLFHCLNQAAQVLTAAVAEEGLFWRIKSGAYSFQVIKT
jgi:hypothetical protein